MIDKREEDLFSVNTALIDIKSTLEKEVRRIKGRKRKQHKVSSQSTAQAEYEFLQQFNFLVCLNKE